MSPELGFRDNEPDGSNVEATEEDFGISGVTPHSPSALARNRVEVEEVRTELRLARRLP